MFNSSYPYRSSQSKTIYHRKIANEIKKRFNPKLIVEIGSNDGAFLKILVKIK